MWQVCAELKFATRVSIVQQLRAKLEQIIKFLIISNAPPPTHTHTQYKKFISFAWSHSSWKMTYPLSVTLCSSPTSSLCFYHNLTSVAPWRVRVTLVCHCVSVCVCVSVAESMKLVLAGTSQAKSNRKWVRGLRISLSIWHLHLPSSPHLSIFHSTPPPTIVPHTHTPAKVVP